MKSILLFACLAGVIFSGAIWGQEAYKETYDKEFLKTKYPQILPVTMRSYAVALDSSKYRVYLLAEIRYSFLQFLRIEGRFTAEAELEMLFNGGPEQLTSRIWRVKVEAPDYFTANSRTHYATTVDSLDMEAGSYSILFKHRDLNGEQRLSFRQKLTLKDPSGINAALPLLYYPDAPERDGIPGLAFRPSPLQSNWYFNSDMGLFLQVQRQDTSAAVFAHIRLLDNESGAELYQLDTLHTSGSRVTRLSLVLPRTLFREKTYRLEVAQGSGEDSTRYILPIAVQWFDKPLSRWSPELSTRPLEYIVDNTVFKPLTKGNPEEKLTRVREFWDERDPTPATPFNELEKEFYSRVDSTLKLFSNRGQLGWQTDPGKIYISNGPPMEIDDHSLAPIANPYLRWTYFQDGKRIDFTFRALDGRKEYVLTDASEKDL